MSRREIIAQGPMGLIHAKPLFALICWPKKVLREKPGVFRQRWWLVLHPDGKRICHWRVMDSTDVPVDRALE